MFYYCEKVFIVMNIWMTERNSMKHQRVCKDFEIRFFGEYHDLYAQSDTFMLADVFENFRNMCFKIYELDLDLD